MNIKQSLQLKIGQQLTMTPQLQQSIHLLQLSTLELQTEIQETLERNIMLEEEDDQDEKEGDMVLDDGVALNGAKETSHTSDEGLNGADVVAEGDAPYEERIPDELALDTSWEDTYDIPSFGGSDEEWNLDFNDTRSESLQEHLLWQLELSTFSARDRLIGETLIDAIDENGFISSLEDIHEGLASQISELELDEVEAVLHAIQNFDPPGIAARDLRESLMLQLRNLSSETAWIGLAQRLLSDHFNLLAVRDFAQLKRRLSIDDATLQAVIQLIQSLKPRPGMQISNTTPDYVVPDVLVKKINGTWHAELNPEAVPHLRVNGRYAGLIKQARGNRDSMFLKTQLQEARWFIRSLHSRNTTLLSVTRRIVAHQKDFFEQGEAAMKPLILHDIAAELDMHESTISRTTTHKYMHTPRGIFEMKYFFSSHVTTEAGGTCSSIAIRAMIKQFIHNEQQGKPLSDSKLGALLAEQGINIARRTIAKYREALAIPPSNERKRLA